jgi:TatD DNase family protein
MELVDTHCHLYSEPLCRDVDAVLGRARSAQVRHVIVPAYDLGSWPEVKALACRSGVYAAYGLHPWVAHEPLEAAALAATLRAERAVAVGEIGLDFVIEGFDRARQLEMLRTQLEVARELGLPVLLHCRSAFEELLALLRTFSPHLRGLVHAFSRGPELASRFVELGLSVAFGGAITRSNATRARRAAAAVPWESLVLETDAPSIGLEGIEPARVEPRHVHDVALALAQIRGESVQVVAERTSSNARELFGLP